MNNAANRSSVNDALTPASEARRARTRQRAVVENSAYTAFCARAIRAAGRRIADGDVDASPEPAHLADDLDQALAATVAGLRAFGYSWADIANRLGTTRQATQQRWNQAAERRRAAPRSECPTE
jgi:hypothetical protein